MTTNTPEESAKPAYAIAIVGGALLWLAATLVSGKREAWDSSLYWTVARTVQEFLELARKKPNALTCGSTGTGATLRKHAAEPSNWVEIRPCGAKPRDRYRLVECSTSGKAGLQKRRHLTTSRRESASER